MADIRPDSQPLLAHQVAPHRFESALCSTRLPQNTQPLASLGGEKFSGVVIGSM